MVHADVNGDGKVVEEEICASGNPALTDAAMDTVRKTGFGQARAQRQIYVNVTFGQ